MEWVQKKHANFTTNIKEDVQLIKEIGHNSFRMSKNLFKFWRKKALCLLLKREAWDIIKMFLLNTCSHAIDMTKLK